MGKNGTGKIGLTGKIKNYFTISSQDFPGGPVVENPSYNAGDTGLTPGQGTKIPHAEGQLSPRAATAEPACHDY